MEQDRIDQWAETLLVLVKAASKAGNLEAERDEARVIGEEVNVDGGFRLMQRVASRTGELGRERKIPFAIGYVERWWNGIGRWLS